MEAQQRVRGTRDHELDRLPGTGRDKAFRLSKDAEGAGYAVEAGSGGEVVGYLALFDETLVAAAHVVECLVRQPGRAFSRHQLMDAAIGEGQIVLERTIDVHVKTLRKKLDEAGGTPDLIETVRGVEYRFREAG